MNKNDLNWFTPWYACIWCNSSCQRHCDGIKAEDLLGNYEENEKRSENVDKRRTSCLVFLHFSRVATSISYESPWIVILFLDSRVIANHAGISNDDFKRRNKRSQPNNCAAHAARILVAAFGDGTANEQIVGRRFEKFRSEGKNVRYELRGKRSILSIVDASRWRLDLGEINFDRILSFAT